VAQRCQQKTPLLRRMLVYRFFVIISLEMGQKQTNKQQSAINRGSNSKYQQQQQQPQQGQLIDSNNSNISNNSISNNVAIYDQNVEVC
jgi:hypothetical protein